MDCLKIYVISISGKAIFAFSADSDPVAVVTFKNMVRDEYRSEVVVLDHLCDLVGGCVSDLAVSDLGYARRRVVVKPSGEYVFDVCRKFLKENGFE